MTKETARLFFLKRHYNHPTVSTVQSAHYAARMTQYKPGTAIGSTGGTGRATKPEGKVNDTAYPSGGT